MSDSPILFNPNFINLEYVYDRVYQWLTQGGFFSNGLQIPSEFTFWVKIFSYSLTLVLSFGLIVLLWRISQIRHDEKEKLISLFETAVKEQKVRNEEWEKVLKYLESDNPSDWKLAIINADTILDKMIKGLNYPGENLGERLKNVEVSDFVSLQDAWEAHKIRNQIAHEGDFQLTKREARRVISLFENVFKEFDYI